MRIRVPAIAKVLLLSFIFSACFLSASYGQLLQLVKDINTTSFSNSFPHDFNIANNKLFFIATGNSGSSGLWLTDGTEAGTIMLSPSSPLNSLGDIIAYNGKIYFSWNDGINGYELWVSDGTVAGTTIFKDCYPGANGSYPRNFTVANNKLFFMGDNVDGDRRLFASDGTPAGTVVVRNNYIDILNGTSDFPVLGTDVYFRGDDGTGSGYGLWKSDGTLVGTVLVKANGMIPGTTGCNYAVLNNRLYFSGFDYVNGSELWSTDGTTAGTNMVLNLHTDAGAVLYGGDPQNLIVYNSLLYFTGVDDTHGPELFVTDGSAPGTHIVKDIVPGSDGGLPYQSVVFNGLLYFTCAGTPALWKSDGTEAGTQQVQTGINFARIAAVWNNKMYLVPSFSDDMLWESDGTTGGTRPIHLQNTNNPVTSLASDMKYKEFNGALYLCASNSDVTVGFELARLTTGALPLHLLSFTGDLQNSNDVLQWTTADEVNTDRFTVQQSLDGAIFTTIASVTAAGNKAGKSTYNYTQPATRNAGGYYRLQMIDKDGKFTYSPVIKLKRTAGRGLSAVYNVTTKQVVINNYEQAKCNWRLLSLNGSCIKQGGSGNALININATGLTAGMYILSYSTGTTTASTRVVVF
jgi:ELWxxDGT repeat protein